MAYLLAPGVSYCVAGERFVFLDVRHDRYFCLPAVAEVAFRALVSEGAPAALDHDALRAMVADGAIELVPGAQRRISNQLDLEEPRASLVDQTVRPVSACLLVRALADLCLAIAGLKGRSLEAIIARIEERKALNRAANRSSARSFQEIGAAFVACERVVSSHDRCLPRSIALTMSLLRSGHAPSLVFAVAMRPFAAHCWVQMGDVVLNDRLHNVRKFTPILAV